MDGDVTSIIESELAASLADLLTSYGDEVVHPDAVSLAVSSASVLVEATVVMETQEASDSVLFNLRAAPISQLSFALGYVMQSFSVSTRLIPVPPKELAVSNDALETSGEGGGGGLGPIAGAAGGGALILVCCIVYILHRRARQRGQEENKASKPRPPLQERSERSRKLQRRRVSTFGYLVNRNEEKRALKQPRADNKDGVRVYRSTDVILEELISSVSGWGKVYKVKFRDASDGNELAVLRRLSLEIYTQWSYEEICEYGAFMKKLSHPHLVPIIGVVNNDADDGRIDRGLLMSCVELSLVKFLRISLSSAAVTAWMKSAYLRVGRDVASGLAYLHSHGIGHLALHPGNILLDAKQKVLLTDYGRPKRLLEHNLQSDVPPEDLRHREERPWHYLAPEAFREESDMASDVWALGCILARLASNLPIYTTPVDNSETHDLALRAQITNGDRSPADVMADVQGLPMGLLAFVRECTQVNASNRPTIEFTEQRLSNMALNNTAGKWRSAGQVAGTLPGARALPAPAHTLPGAQALPAPQTRDGGKASASARGGSGAASAAADSALASAFRRGSIQTELEIDEFSEGDAHAMPAPAHDEGALEPHNPLASAFRRGSIQTELEIDESSEGDAHAVPAPAHDEGALEPASILSSDAERADAVKNAELLWLEASRTTSNHESDRMSSRTTSNHKSDRMSRQQSFIEQRISKDISESRVPQQGRQKTLQKRPSSERDGQDSVVHGAIDEAQLRMHRVRLSKDIIIDDEQLRRNRLRI